MHDRPARPTAFCWNQKYPRVCEEKSLSCFWPASRCGSPPHMRGKVRQFFQRYRLRRITPAYAGKSNLLPHTRCRSWDHPRICGEKIVVSRTWCSRSGLPPRMRGKVANAQPEVSMDGITPAYAGKSIQRCVQLTQRGDHPRICGEKAKYWMQGREPEGSPPHMRGKVPLCRADCLCSGITPAYAGKRYAILSTSASVVDHPRVCGEKTGCRPS